MQNIKEKMYNKGFTLMEVLVSSSIFALILIFTTAAVSQSSGYQSKLSVLNKTSEETRRFADMISTDVRGADSELKVYASICKSHNGKEHYIFKNGIAILGLEDDGTSFCVDYQKQNDLIDYSGRAVAISNKDGIKIYISKINIAGEDEGIYYINKAVGFEISSIIPLDVAERVSNKNLLVAIKFGGFAPNDDIIDYGQAIVKFDITAIAPDTSIAKGQSEIRSAVTSRSYN